MTKKKKTVIQITVALLLLGGMLVLGLYLGGAFRQTQGQNDPQIANGNRYANEDITDYSNTDENPSISVPGVDTVYLTANQTHQYFTFNNPEENTCYFEIILSLEDGTVLWKSDYLEPGMSISEFDLTQTLPAGNYENATVTYNCYNLNNFAQLNGGAVNVNLVVE